MTVAGAVFLSLGSLLIRMSTALTSGSYPRSSKNRFWRKSPRLVFVNSLTDLFHDDVPDSYIVRVTRWWTWQNRNPNFKCNPVGMSLNRVRGVLNARKIQFYESTEQRDGIVLQYPHEATMAAQSGDTVLVSRFDTVRVPLRVRHADCSDVWAR